MRLIFGNYYLRCFWRNAHNFTATLLIPLLSRANTFCFWSNVDDVCIFINYKFFKYCKKYKPTHNDFLISFGTFYLFAARAACRQLAQTFELHTRRGTRNDNTTIPPTTDAVGMKAQKQLSIEGEWQIRHRFCVNGTLSV